MKKFEKYIIFLNNTYSRSDNDFYLKQIPGKTTIAVDGGIRFFRKNGIKPDILIGDFDSLPGLPKSYRNSIEILGYSRIKNKTDSQLAVELALQRGAQKIEICGALSAAEIDHTLGNIFLLKLIKQQGTKKNRNIAAAIIDSQKTIRLIKNESLDIHGKSGNYISIIPLSNKCRLRYKGLVYSAPDNNAVFGDSLTLRNQFKGSQATITLSGTALVVYYLNQI